MLEMLKIENKYKLTYFQKIGFFPVLNSFYCAEQLSVPIFSYVYFLTVFCNRFGFVTKILFFSN